MTQLFQELKYLTELEATSLINIIMGEHRDHCMYIERA
jgi:hypothetical protein